jgi:hypothetical protein
LAGETEVLGKKPDPVILCPPKIPHDLTWIRTRATAVGNWPELWPPTRSNLVKDENGDLLSDPHNILNRWKNYFS